MPDAELQPRQAAWQAPHAIAPRDRGGYRGLHVQHVLQADEGSDVDFLIGCRGADVPRHSH